MPRRAVDKRSGRAPSSPSKSTPAATGEGSPVPLVYVILFLALAVSLAFNAYLFVNTRDHVINSRTEELIEEQMFQQSSQKKKDLIARELVKNGERKRSQEGKGAMRQQRPNHADDGPAHVRGAAPGSAHDNSADEVEVEVRNRYRANEVITPEILKLNAKFSARVAVSYKLDALNSFSHCFYAVDESGKKFCLDRTHEPTAINVNVYPCHPLDEELYSGPQAWQLSFSGRLTTSSPGSVLYGASDPPHTRTVEGPRCVAFRTLSTDAPQVGQPVQGQLVLADCDELGETNEESRLFGTWMFNMNQHQLVNVDYPSRTSHSQYCLELPSVAATKGVVQLSPCSRKPALEASWHIQRLHKPKADMLTDHLDLQDFAFNATRSMEIGIYRDIGDMYVDVMNDLLLVHFMNSTPGVVAVCWFAL